MAASKLFSEFQSSNGKYYKIEIWDEDYSGTSPDEFNVAGNGFELTYSGQTDNVYSPIIGSSVSFGLYVQDAPTIALVANLKQYQQDRFYLKIYRGNDAASSTFFWGGYIVQDIIEIEDVSQPFVMTIQATDGISKLKDTLCGTSFFRQFTNQFINALDQVGVLGIYEATDPVLAVVCNWWAQEMTYNINTNPLDEVFADFHAFDTIDEQGFYTNKNWFEILSQMCTIFGLRFYYSNGQYRLEQLFERDGSFVEHTYQKDKTKIGATSAVNYTKTLDQTTNKARLAGNIFNFLPAVNDVSITLNQESKAMEGVTWNNSNDPDLAIGLVSSALQNQMSFVFNHQIKLFVDVNVNQNNIFAKLKLNVELFDFNNNVTYYLKRTFSGMTPSAPVWTTTQSGSGYEILVGSFIEFKTQQAITGYTEVYQIGGPTTIVTPTIPADGDMSINWDFVGFVNTNGSVRGLNIGNSSSYKMTLQSVNSSFGSIQNQTTRIRAVSPNADINGLVSYELPETSIFTGQGERGSLVKQTDVGGLLIKVPYTNWREGNSGSYQSIQRLMCQEFLKLMDEPVQKYSGQMFSSHNFRQRLTFDGNNWIQLGGTYNANRDEWDGEWFVINRAVITPTFDDDIFVNTEMSFGNVNGSTGGVSFDGVDAVNLDTNVLDVTTTANVGTDLDVGGNTGLTGSLSVTGGSTLQSTSVGAFTTTQQVSVTINNITGTPGGSETLTLNDHFNFISYSGGNGTYTITLPNADSGVIMRFKTDDTVAANKTITLSPQSGQRIDAESTYAMDRSYDGITLLGNNSNWFIIQKKEK